MFVQHDSHQTLPGRSAAEPGGDDEGASDSLEDAARDERDYARERLREELGRDPSEEEINGWLREQTEGY
jgi:hypothetical protein